MPQVIPVAVALLVLTPVVVLARRELDLLSLDDDIPRILGVRLERTRLIALGGAALLTAAAVSAIGVVGFVGLVAPHAARALVGGRHCAVAAGRGAARRSTGQRRRQPRPHTAGARRRSPRAC